MTRLRLIEADPTEIADEDQAHRARWIPRLRTLTAASDERVEQLYAHVLESRERWPGHGKIPASPPEIQKPRRRNPALELAALRAR